MPVLENLLKCIIMFYLSFNPDYLARTVKNHFTQIVIQAHTFRYDFRIVAQYDF